MSQSNWACIPVYKKQLFSWISCKDKATGYRLQITSPWNPHCWLISYWCSLRIPAWYFRLWISQKSKRCLSCCLYRQHLLKLRTCGWHQSLRPHRLCLKRAPILFLSEQWDAPVLADVWQRTEQNDWSYLIRLLCRKKNICSREIKSLSIQIVIPTGCLPTTGWIWRSLWMKIFVKRECGKVVGPFPYIMYTGVKIPTRSFTGRILPFKAPM